jgi:superfamily II DNA or RNA helicase
MVILHTCWKDGRLYVWGEQEAVATDVHAVAPEAFFSAVSPFDPGEASIKNSLSSLSGDWENNGAFHSQMIQLALPTRRANGGGLPVPSQPFLANDETSGPFGEKPFFLRTWAVSAVDLTWRQTAVFLGTVKEKRLAADVFAAEDVMRFAELFRYVGALVARGRFLPGMVKVSETAYESRWRPSLDRAERIRLERLASRLPHAATDGQSALTVAEDFLNEIVDRLVRVSVVTTLSRVQAERGKFYSAHDAWFAALRGETRTIRWEGQADLEELLKQLNVWRRPVEEGRNRDEHLVFCLETPAEPSKPWFLGISISTGKELLAFSLDDGGLLNRAPGDSVLLALGQAAQLFSPLAQSEFHTEGFGCHLSAQDAYVFLTVSGALLKASGYEVRLPPWWQNNQARILTLAADVSPHLSSAGPTNQILNEKMDIQWSVLLNGEPISAEELESLLQPQSPLVFFRGQWIQVDVKQIQDAIRIEQRKNSDTQSALEIVRLALGAGAGHYGLDVSTVRGVGWVDPFLKQLNGVSAFEILSAPDAFCGVLRPYQLRGYSWLVYLRIWGFGACLADDMGLGKTIQALAFLLHEKDRGEKRPVLLVGPMSVLGNWLREAQRFAPSLRCMLHHGPQRWHGDSFAREAQQVDMVVTSYHLLYRDYADLRKVTWAGILLDEAQNIKNPDTHQAQAARALQAEYRIALTGTPIENHVGDVWSIMDFLNPGILGKKSVFRERFFRPIQSGTDPGARSRLRRATAPFILRRLKIDKQIIADLPEKMESKVFCPLTLEQARLYREVLETFQREIEMAEGVSRRGMILAVLTHLKQICNHPVNYLRQGQVLSRRSGKLVRLEEMLEEAFARGESALVFTQYAEMGALLKRHLCHVFACDMPFLYGGVPRKERDRMVQEFQESTEPQAFVLSLKAGGIGLNLTRATHVFHYDRWWNPAVENQATDRAFRIGQTHNVMVHKFICGGTLEDRIDAMIESKTALADEIVTSGESFLTELSNAELRDVLRLSDAVIEDEEAEAGHE